MGRNMLGVFIRGPLEIWRVNFGGWPREVSSLRQVQESPQDVHGTWSIPLYLDRMTGAHPRGGRGGGYSLQKRVLTVVRMPRSCGCREPT